MPSRLHRFVAAVVLAFRCAAVRAGATATRSPRNAPPGPARRRPRWKEAFDSTPTTARYPALLPMRGVLRVMVYMMPIMTLVRMPSRKARAPRRSLTYADADLPDLLSLSRRIIDGGELTREEARRLFVLEGEEVYDLFYACAQSSPALSRQPRDVLQYFADQVRQLQRGLQVLCQSGHLTPASRLTRMMDGAEVAEAAPTPGNRVPALWHRQQRPGPTQREWPKIMEAVTGHEGSGRHLPCATLGTLTEEQARISRKPAFAASITTSKRHKEFFLQIVTTYSWQERVEHGAVGPAGRTGDVLRLHFRHGRNPSRPR